MNHSWEMLEGKNAVLFSLKFISDFKIKQTSIIDWWAYENEIKIWNVFLKPLRLPGQQMQYFAIFCPLCRQKRNDKHNVSRQISAYHLRWFIYDKCSLITCSVIMLRFGDFNHSLILNFDSKVSMNTKNL